MVQLTTFISESPTKYPHFCWHPFSGGCPIKWIGMRNLAGMQTLSESHFYNIQDALLRSSAKSVIIVMREFHRNVQRLLHASRCGTS